MTGLAIVGMSAFLTSWGVASALSRANARQRAAARHVRVDHIRIMIEAEGVDIGDGSYRGPGTIPMIPEGLDAVRHIEGRRP